MNRGRRIAIGTIDPTAKIPFHRAYTQTYLPLIQPFCLSPLDLDPSDADSSSAAPSDQDLTNWLRCIDSLVAKDSSPQSVDRSLGAAESILGLRSSEAERATILACKPRLTDIILNISHGFEDAMVTKATKVQVLLMLLTHKLAN